MQTRQWHLFLVLVVGLPWNSTAAKVFSFPKWPSWCYESASSLLKIHAKKNFRSSRGQIITSHLCQHTERLRALPSAVCYDSGPYHFFYAAAALASFPGRVGTWPGNKATAAPASHHCIFIANKTSHHCIFIANKTSHNCVTLYSFSPYGSLAIGTTRSMVVLKLQVVWSFLFNVLHHLSSWYVSPIFW